MRIDHSQTKIRGRLGQGRGLRSITAKVQGSTLALQQLNYWRGQGHVVTVKEVKGLAGPRVFEFTVYQKGEGNDA